MKVGILTFPNSTSYGAALQMYALSHTVGTLGHEAEVVNYHNAYMKAEKHMGMGKPGWKTVARRLLHHRLYRVFNAFEKNNLVCYPPKAFDRREKLPEIGKRYDAVICGSDQVWNPDITDGDISYFLDFCGQDTRRIAYAPSFGIDSFSDAFCNKISSEVKQFHSLSAREVPGQLLLQQLTGREVPLVVDPTLLMDASEWEKMEKTHPAAAGDYIFYYTVRSSSVLRQKCLELAKKTGMKIVMVGGNPLKKRKDDVVEHVIDISPEQWLYLLHHARYVVTNSFHGTAFSINYRKDFYVEYSSLTNSRLTQIVQSMGLTDRVVGETPLDGTVADYTTADQMLPKIRRDSLDYLTQALQ